MIYFTLLNSCNEAVKGGQHREMHPTRMGGTKRERCEAEGTRAPDGWLTSKFVAAGQQM